MTGPQAVHAVFQHVLDIYVCETEKTAAVWRQFNDTNVIAAEIIKQQLLAEQRLFGEFLGTPEPPAAGILTDPLTIEASTKRLIQLAARRLPFLAAQDEDWWLTQVRFFDVDHERIWIFWRCVLDSANCRTQLSAVLQ